VHTVDVARVRKRFSARGRWVLDGVDLVADPGTLTVIAGGNGSGKSTLLRIVAGASDPTSGKVRRRARSVGYVPERLPTSLRMTGNQYVAHMGRMRGLSANRAGRRASELFDRLELRPGPDVPIGSLSKGNSQKVALTQALLAAPELLVLDEPFSGLDEPAAAALIDLVEEARSAGAAALLSAHDTEVAGGADESFVLTDGRLVAGVSAAAAMMELVLQPVDQRANVADLPAVLDHQWSGRLLTVWSHDADAVLRFALTAGWSLVEARRTGGVR
jgi:ABC-type multidrug transport system ATPase subunit